MVTELGTDNVRKDPGPQPLVEVMAGVLWESTEPLHANHLSQYFLASFFKIFLFIYGYAWYLLLCTGFLSLQLAGCRHSGSVIGRHGGSSRITDRICVPCIGRQIVKCWTTREVPHFISLLFRSILTKQRNPKNFRGERKCSPSFLISV